MSSVGYEVSTSALVSLTANTPRTCLMVITPSTFGGVLTFCSVGFDGDTASENPALVQIVRSTNATNSTPGTNNTNENTNIVQPRGQTITAGFTAFSASTSEPTVLTRMREYPLTVVGGLVMEELPVGREIEWLGVSSGLGVRITTPAGAASVNARVDMAFERI